MCRCLYIYRTLTVTYLSRAVTERSDNIAFDDARERFLRSAADDHLQTQLRARGVRSGRLALSYSASAPRQLGMRPVRESESRL